MRSVSQCDSSHGCQAWEEEQEELRPAYQLRGLSLQLFAPVRSLLRYWEIVRSKCKKELP